MIDNVLEARVSSMVRDALEQSGALMGLDERDAGEVIDMVVSEVIGELLYGDAFEDLVYSLSERCYGDVVGMPDLSVEPTRDARAIGQGEETRRAHEDRDWGTR